MAELNELDRLRAENKRLHDLLDHGGNLPPEIFGARKQGLADLERLLAEPGDDPQWEIIGNLTLHDFKILNTDVPALGAISPNLGRDTFTPVFFEPDYWKDRKRVHARVAFCGAPNEAMKPVNARAEAIFDAWKRSTTPWDKPPIFRGDCIEPGQRGPVVYSKIRYAIGGKPGLWRRIKRARWTPWNVFVRWRNHRRRLRHLATIYDHPSSIRRREGRQ